MMKRFGWIVSLCLAASGAQATPLAQPGQQTETSSAPVARGVPLRVQVNYALAVPMNRDGAIDEQKAAILSMHGTLYAMAAQECDQLRAVMPGDCRIVSLGINDTPQFFNPMNQSMQFGANVALELIPRLGDPGPAPAH